MYARIHNVAFLTRLPFSKDYTFRVTSSVFAWEIFFAKKKKRNTRSITWTNPTRKYRKNDKNAISIWAVIVSAVEHQCKSGILLKNGFLRFKTLT